MSKWLQMRPEVLPVTPRPEGFEINRATYADDRCCTYRGIDNLHTAEQ